jgi:hypothetical protein
MDLIMEVRGSIARLDALNKIMKIAPNNRVPYDKRYGILLLLNPKPGVLLKPKGISLYLLTSNIKEYN